MTMFAGCRSAELFDAATSTTFPLLVLYPTSSPEQPSQLGPYPASLSTDAPIAAGMFPLVVISHGTGGSPLLYRTLAAHLARGGFVVAMPEHPRNNRNNDDLAGTHVILANRPRHIRIVIDWMLTSEDLAPSLHPHTVAIIGHSLGGYTALAVAGGRPTAFAHETPDRRPRTVNVTPDDRVAALVLLAPATAWFMADGALNDVSVPILMFTAGQDEHTLRWQGEIVTSGVPDRALVDHRIVPNAGHFSFTSPFPVVMISPALTPSQDPEGFDRQRFHEHMNDEVLAFLRRVTRARRPPRPPPGPATS